MFNKGSDRVWAQEGLDPMQRRRCFENSSGLPDGSILCYLVHLVTKMTKKLLIPSKSNSQSVIHLLGGSWAVIISAVTSPLIWVISIVALLITTHEPPSRPYTLYPYRIPIDHFIGTLQGTLITTHEPPSTHHGIEGFSTSTCARHLLA